ncbi:MAG: hypothetical protein ABIL06_24880 [Pseudomonadota bacterium]
MKKERGIALVTVLILVLVFSVVGVAMMILSRRDVGESQRNRKLQMALAAAEAGIDQAIWELEQSDTWTGNTAWQTIGAPPDETSFICSVDTQDLPTNVYAINCTGTADRVINVFGGGSSEVRKRLKVLVEMAPPINGEDYALFTNGNLNLNGVAHDVDGNDSGRVNYCTTDGSPLQTTDVPQITNACECPEIDTPTLTSLADTQGTHYYVNIDVAQIGGKVKTTVFQPPNDPVPTEFWNDAPKNTVPNVIFVEGDFTATGNYELWGLYIVEGDVALGGNVEVHGGIYATGTVTWSHGNPYIEGTVFGCGGATRISGNVQIEYEAEYAEELGAYLETIPGVGTQILSYQDISY